MPVRRSKRRESATCLRTPGFHAEEFKPEAEVLDAVGRQVRRCSGPLISEHYSCADTARQALAARDIHG